MVQATALVRMYADHMMLNFQIQNIPHFYFYDESLGFAKIILLHIEIELQCLDKPGLPMEP